MDRKRALSWAGRYFLLTSAVTLIGGALVVAGLYYAYQFGTVIPVLGYGVPYPGTGRSIGGIVAILLGVVVWRGGKAWALYLTMTGAMQEELGETFDTEHVKSDIVSVLDDRLSDMQQDLQSVNRELRNLTDSSGFEFGDEK